MKRRSLLTLLVGSGTLTGCLSDGNDAPLISKSSATESMTSKPRDRQSPVHMTTDGVEAAFKIVDGHSPTKDTAGAEFADKTVTVTGTMDPEGCNKPILDRVSYVSSRGRIELTVGEYSPYSNTVTQECGNASYDFQIVVTVDEANLTDVKLIFDHPTDENQMFGLDRT